MDRFGDDAFFLGERDEAGVVGELGEEGASVGRADQALQAAQERVLQMLGLPPEGRKFTPHVSLARLRGTSAEEIARFIALSGRFQPLEFPVGRFVLFSSKDSVGGGPYLVEQAYPLAA